MDTWATSSVTPLLNTHLVLGAESPEARAKFHQDEAQARHARLFPFDLRPQAHDIIRTWAFYTIAKAYFHFGTDENGMPFEDQEKLRAALPWKDIVISGHAQTGSREKISKSKGHHVTPAELVEKYTADGLRYWSGSCKLGTDTVYDEKTLGEGRKLINKLFNATKFALRHLIDYRPDSVGARLDSPSGGNGREAAEGESSLAPANAITYPTDLWLLSRLNDCIARATRAQDEYDFADAKQAVEDFFWADFCDNYLELSKGRLYGEPLALEAHSVAQATLPAIESGDRSVAATGWTPEQLRLSAQATLYIALSSVLRLFAPTLPHITEECWSWYFAQFSNKRSIHEENWPVGARLDSPSGGTGQDVAQGESSLAPTENIAAALLLSTLAAVRKAKSELGVSIKKPLARLDIYAVDGGIAGGSGEQVWDAATLLHPVLGDLLSACNTAEAQLCSGPPPEGAVTTERNPVAVVCSLAEE